eukprot:GILI01010846.1.p1 GENE.GILI01010846.1~~GILI01010846.1.p1  ORF type:complete len:433 (+),score=114.27 GILI01010846.1:68-1366(+)
MSFEIFTNDTLPHQQDGKKLVLGLTGLPARGKTYMARKLCRYLSWLGFSTEVFNIGNYRRDKVGVNIPAEWFDQNNEEGRAARDQCADAALADAIAFLKTSEGDVAIYDGTNCTRARRQKVEAAVSAESDMQLLWIESECTNEELVELNIRQTKISSPDYKHKDPQQAVEDYRQRIAQYQQYYEPLGEPDRLSSFVKVINIGEQLVLNRIHGFIPGRIVAFLMNLHTIPRPILMCRHGESEYNVENKIGGDPPLSSRGVLFAKRLADYLDTCSEVKEGSVRLWTSTMQRARETVSHLRLPTSPVHWKALDEINVGMCDGWSYEDVEHRMPQEHHLRTKNKLRYRYPRGESYMDLIQRLEPIIFELERCRDPVVLVGHQAVLRCLYAYFTGRSLDEVPHLDIPLHTIIQLTPRTYHCDENRVALDVAPVKTDT